ncbi:MAG: GTPase HflX [Opitutales bacterium]
MLETADLSPRVERALLVGIEMRDSNPGEAQSLLDELAELVQNLHIGVVAQVMAKVREPSPRFFLGKGKAEEVLMQARSQEADCLVFDFELSPAQQRNWEKESGVTVIDRQEVILDIFGDRAQTREAVLQVELARMEYALPRLRGAWSHLSRQRGGGVTQRGEGEKQIQLDRRMMRDRIARLKKELETVRQHRSVQRQKRLRVPVPTAALVGYTNAGKSSLLNALTGASVQAEDKLFATLDPTSRRADLPSGQTIVLTDTVGFVRNLPHNLVDAFKATLEEALVADFLIHVVDVSNPEAEAHLATTQSVLKELGAGERPTLLALNKLDLLEDPHPLELLRACHPNTYAVSAHTGEGLEALKDALDACLRELLKPTALLIPHDRYDLVNRLHQAGAVQFEKPLDAGVYIEGRLPQRLVGPMKPFALNGRRPVGAFESPNGTHD